MTAILFTLSLFFVIPLAFADPNLRPIMGVLSWPSDFPDLYDPSIYSNVHGKIVSFIEAGGARVAPIPWDSGIQNIIALLKSVNGVVIAGDTTKLFETNIFGKRKATDFMNAIKEIITYVIQINQNGTYFPLVGLNNGFDAIAAQIGGDLSILEAISDPKDRSHEIILTDNQSRIFSMVATYQMDYVQNAPLLSFNNTYAVRHSKFTESILLRSFFKVVANYKEDLFDDCVAVAEGIDMPVYLIQFNPQVGRQSLIDGDLMSYYVNKAIYSGLTNFIVNESRQNNNSFGNIDTEDASLIYQVTPTYFGPGAARVYFLNQNF